MFCFVLSAHEHDAAFCQQGSGFPTYIYIITFSSSTEGISNVYSSLLHARN